MKNFEKVLEQLKNLHLPISEFTVIGGACLAIRNLRDTSDIDILVTMELWNELVFKFSITNHENYQSIHAGSIEILGGVNPAWTPNGFSDVPGLIQSSQNIGGINFAPLDYIKSVKLKLNRPKDLIDVELIDEYLGLHTIC